MGINGQSLTQTSFENFAYQPGPIKQTLIEDIHVHVEIS